MEFYNDEIEQIRRLVNEQALNGNRYIAFCDNGEKLSIDDLAFFQDDWSANEYCYENTTDRDRYALTTAGKVIEQLDHQLSQGEQFDNLKNENMNQQNFDFLKDQVKFTGFGESLENDLKANVQKGEPTFKLLYDHKFGNDESMATLNFRRSDQNDMYFFNNYQLSVKQSGADDITKQTFYVGKDNTFTLKEGYNLLCGRAVNKDLVNKDKEAYNAWVQLDFKETDTKGNYKLKHYTENYGYDLSEALGKLPIKELDNLEDKSKLIESLQKGNRQSAIFLIDGSEQKRFIEANPQFKSITVYDGNMTRIRQDHKQGQSNPQKEDSTRNKQSQKAGDADKDNSKAQKKSKKHGITG